MSIGQIIVLVGVVGAFVLFAVVLGWVDYHTQQTMAKKDDKSAVAASGTAQARWAQPSGDRLQHAAR